MSNIAFTITGSGNISLSYNNRSYLINSDHINYTDVVNCLKSKQYNNLYKYLNVTDTIAGKLKGHIEFKDGLVYWNNIPLNNTITDRILKFYKEGLPYEPLLNFIKNLMLNPSENSRNQIYRFLEFNNLPITPSGKILFYKRVNDNYTDCHTGTFNNCIGSRVTMDRKYVVEDENLTCSSGLHVCSLGYLKTFNQGKKIVICEVDPAHIVSVPTDYENTKVRVCEYLVVGEWSSDEVDMFDGDLVRNQDGSEYEYDDECEDDDVNSCECDSFIEECCGGLPECREDCDCNINKHLKPFDVIKHVDQLFKYGYKGDGSKFYNVRDKSGKFVKK